MNKKSILFLPVIFALSSCQITKVNLTEFYEHESSHRDEVFSHEITEYSAFKNLNENKKSYLMYIYSDPNCMCYLELKSQSLDTVLNYNLLVYTMNKDVIKGKNTYGYNLNNHDFPSIVIFEFGKVKYQIHYDQYEYFESSAKFNEYIFERINL